MTTFLSSGVYGREEQPSIRQIDSVSTSVAGFIGVAERGPINEATLITSFGQFQRVFGGHLAGSYRHLPLAVMAFFDNGGQIAYVTRVVHMTDAADEDTLTATRSSVVLTVGGGSEVARLQGNDYPLNLEPSDQLVLSVNGGADDPATFTATAAHLDSDVGPFVLVDGQVLVVEIDGGETQTITFSEGADFVDIGAATADEVAVVVNKTLRGGRAFVSVGAVRIESDTRGTSSSVEVTAATNADGLGFAEASAAVGTGNVANINAVTQAEVEAVVEAAIAGVAVEAGDTLSIVTVLEGAAASLEAVDPTADAFGFGAAVTGSDDALINVLRAQELHPAGLAYGVVVQAATSGEADRFDLLFTEDGLTVEAYRNVSADPAEDDYVVDVVAAASAKFQVVHLGAEDDPRPANQSKTINGGDAGLAGLVDADFIGGNTNGSVGLRAFDAVLDLSILAAPGKASAALHAAMLTYAETTRDGSVFLVLDVPEGSSASAAITYVQTTASLLNASEYAATYWPWLKVSNPSVSIFGVGSTVTVSPSGAVVGTYARVDGARDGGVYDSPAGYERAALRSVLGLETTDVNQKAYRDLVYPKRINPIRTSPNRPIYIDGGRTLKAGGNFPHVMQRRSVNMIKRSLEDGLDFARHQNNDSVLQGRIRRTVTAFLTIQMNLGAFRSRDPETAFYVLCGPNENPPEVVLSGKVVIKIGLAMGTPAEFVEFVLSQDTRPFALV